LQHSTGQLRGESWKLEDRSRKKGKETRKSDQVVGLSWLSLKEWKD